MFWSSPPSPPAERTVMKTPPRPRGTRSLKVSTKFRKNASPVAAQSEGRAPTSSLPDPSNTKQHAIRARSRSGSKARHDNGCNNVGNFQLDGMMLEDSSLSSSTTCVSSQSSYSASTSSSAVQTVPTVAGSTEDDWSHLVEANSSTEDHLLSSSSSVSSWMLSLSDAASLTGASLSSTDVHKEKAAVPTKDRKSRKKVRFNEVPEVHIVLQTKVQQAFGMYAERHDETEALWYTPKEQISMRQQPLDTLEDVLQKAITMASEGRSRRPVSKQRVCKFFAALLEDLEQKGNFTTRGLESSLRDIATGQPSSALVDTVVAAVLMEQRRLRHETVSRSFDYDKHAVAVAKASFRHSRRSRAEALKLGEMDAMNVAEESYSRMFLSPEIAVEEHVSTTRGMVKAERRSRDRTADKPTTHGVFGAKTGKGSRDKRLLTARQKNIRRTPERLLSLKGKFDF